MIWVLLEFRTACKKMENQCRSELYHRQSWRYSCSFWECHMEFGTACKKWKTSVEANFCHHHQSWDTAALSEIGIWSSELDVYKKSMHLELGMCKWWIAKKCEQWLSGWNLPVSQPSLYGLEFHFLSWSCHAHNELCKSQQLSGRHFFPIFAQQFFSRVLLQNDRQKMRGENPDRTCYCPQGVATQTHECPMLHTPGCKLFSHTVSHFYSRTTFTPHKSMFLLTIFMV